MEFNFSKEEELWRWAVKDFADRELVSMDLTIFDRAFRKTIKKMGELGFLGVTLPEAYGGDPANWAMLGILIEELAQVNAGVAYFILVNHNAGAILDTFAEDDLKARWLPDIIQGRVIPCVAWSEPSSGWDVDALTARAEPRGEQYIITGDKAPVSFGMAADLALTIAQVESVGSTAFTVPLESSGINRSAMSSMGLTLAAPAELQFDAVAVAKDHRIGREGEGRQPAVTAGPLNSVNQIAVGLICLGMAQAALKATVPYAKDRHAFGKPIAKFQGIAQKVAEDATLIEAGKWLCYRALWLKDSGKDCHKEAAMCGWWCPKISYQAIQNSLLIHGHAGYSDDHPFGMMLKDIVGFEMMSGGESLQKTIVGHRIFGDIGIPDEMMGTMGNI